MSTAAPKVIPSTLVDSAVDVRSLDAFGVDTPAPFIVLRNRIVVDGAQGANGVNCYRTASDDDPIDTPCVVADNDIVVRGGATGYYAGIDSMRGVLAHNSIEVLGLQHVVGVRLWVDGTVVANAFDVSGGTFDHSGIIDMAGGDFIGNVFTDRPLPCAVHDPNTGTCAVGTLAELADGAACVTSGVCTRAEANLMVAAGGVGPTVLAVDEGAPTTIAVDRDGDCRGSTVVEAGSDETIDP
jgi:hypothetical protein